jgi:DNA primase
MSSSSIEEIKSRLGVVDVIGGYVKLEKAGVNYKARCPFHNEKTASFFISPARNSYHCFGCGKGGDILTFVQEVEGLDFMGALKMLAERAGVTLEREKVGERSEKEKLLAAMTDASLFFQSILNKNAPAREYLESRGLTADTIRQFEVGYAPDGWRVGHEFLAGRKHSDEVLEKAGLIIRSPKGPFYDRFRNRIMFPIKDQMGNTIGFSGRILGSELSSDGTPLAKYMNSPETPLYQKSKVLFGIDRAKQAIRKSECTVLVEGQMDLVMSHQAGVTNAVAVSGTALTDEHLTMLKRLSENIVMAFDADKAGINAAGRALGMALALGMDVKVALLPGGMDPADVVRANPADWTRAIKEAQHVIDFYLAVYLSQKLDGSTLRKKIDTELIPYVARLASSLDQGHFVKKIAQAVGIEETAVWESVKRARKDIARPATAPTTPSPEKAPAKLRSTQIFGKLLGIMSFLEHKNDSDALLEKIKTETTRILGLEKYQALESEEKEGLGALALEAEIRNEEEQSLKKNADELIGNLEEAFLEERFASIMKSLRDAEGQGDQNLLQKYLAECQMITSQITTLKKKRYEQKN